EEVLLLPAALESRNACQKASPDGRHGGQHQTAPEPERLPPGWPHDEGEPGPLFVPCAVAARGDDPEEIPPRRNVRVSAGSIRPGLGPIVVEPLETIAESRLSGTHERGGREAHLEAAFVRLEDDLGRDRMLAVLAGDLLDHDRRGPGPGRQRTRIDHDDAVL